MQMMFEIIADALQSTGDKDRHPCDYLNFYCLGNREEPSKELSPPNDQTSNGNATVYNIFFTVSSVSSSSSSRGVLTLFYFRFRQQKSIEDL